jgi:hypothetical protein
MYFRHPERKRRRGLCFAPPPQPMPIRRIPRLARVMALAIRLEQLLREGVVKTQAQLAQLGHVTPSRLTQILGLMRLAPDIQEDILFLPPTEQCRGGLTERQLRPLLRTLLWREQRRLWAKLKPHQSSQSTDLR